MFFYIYNLYSIYIYSVTPCPTGHSTGFTTIWPLCSASQETGAASSVQTKHRRWKAFPRLMQCLNWLSWELAWSQQLPTEAAMYCLQNQAAVCRSILGPALISWLCHCPTQVATIFSLLIQGRGSSKDPGKPET